jgi:hypothetical protein
MTIVRLPPKQVHKGQLGIVGIGGDWSIVAQRRSVKPGLDTASGIASLHGQAEAGSDWVWGH